MAIEVTTEIAPLPTRDRILGSAERLFAQYGFDGVSIRQIGAAACVQIALINYHFGTKDKLYRAVFESRIRPVSERRRAALATAIAMQPRPSLKAVLEALVWPWVEMRSTVDGRDYTRLIAREVNDPRESARGIVADLLDPIAHDFIAAMERALPYHSKADVHWAYHFLIGTLLLILANPERITRLSGELFVGQSDTEVVNRLVSFVERALPAEEERHR